MDANVNHKGTESPTAVASSKDVSGTGGNSLEKGVDNALNGIRDKASSMGSSASAMSDPMTSSIEASAEGADPMATGARRTGAALDTTGTEMGDGVGRTV